MFQIQKIEINCVENRRLYLPLVVSSIAMAGILFLAAREPIQSVFNDIVEGKPVPVGGDKGAFGPQESLGEGDNSLSYFLNLPTR